ncbi:hypothetical protein [Herbaspirillum sp. RV1423]|uniref:hypothetical protein n=1 Tax=Herbaspirillum sp. RV1423 TaxID=1443993 RepID=UPI0004B8A9CA|nr:hypothetical protein [Herbaspirillum sp. RV1423]
MSSSSSKNAGNRSFLATLVAVFRSFVGLHSGSGVHHRQRASAFILAILLLFSFTAHMMELDAALLHMLAGLGTDCVWCAVTPY